MQSTSEKNEKNKNFKLKSEKIFVCFMCCLLFGYLLFFFAFVFFSCKCCVYVSFLREGPGYVAMKKQCFNIFLSDEKWLI